MKKLDTAPIHTARRLLWEAAGIDEAIRGWRRQESTGAASSEVLRALAWKRRVVCVQEEGGGWSVCWLARGSSPAPVLLACFGCDRDEDQAWDNEPDLVSAYLFDRGLCVFTLADLRDGVTIKKVAAAAWARLSKIPVQVIRAPDGAAPSGGTSASAKS